MSTSQKFLQSLSTGSSRLNRGSFIRRTLFLDELLIADSELPKHKRTYSEMCFGGYCTVHIPAIYAGYLGRGAMPSGSPTDNLPNLHIRVYVEHLADSLSDKIQVNIADILSDKKI